ncbi:pep a2 [Streptomyces sp. NPDC051940]|uniref:pep a2 n=1 Tax=Streptomyces sp. NPDC051940 TaxID=3155675 RepID=UPI00342985D3
MNTANPCYYHLEVEIGPRRVEQVGRILAAHLRHWDLGVLVEPVTRCAGLLLRAIETHATNKNAVVEMWWNGRHVVTAVSDTEPDLPHPHYGPDGYLAQIAALSDGWGNCPATNGKTIWFSHRARITDSAPLAPAPPAPTLRAARRLPRELPVAAPVAPAVPAAPTGAEPVPAAAAAYAGQPGAGMAARAAVRR